MVDPNVVEVGFSTNDFSIQIPLWSIPTLFLRFVTLTGLCIQIPLWSIPTEIAREANKEAIDDSDSSMVDPNPTVIDVLRPNMRAIQIPLWSIPTPLIVTSAAVLQPHSDSSMVDPNCQEKSTIQKC